MEGIDLNNNVELNIDLIIEENSYYIFVIIHNFVGNKLFYHDLAKIIGDTCYLFRIIKIILKILNRI